MKNISFFSYKGGAGRTSLLYNTLPFLAEELGATENNPIIVLDLDLDSKGLTYLVNGNSNINAIQVLKGDTAISSARGGSLKTHPFFKQLCPIGELVGLSPDNNGAILFVSANAKEGAEYLGVTNNYDGRYASLKALNRLCEDYNCKSIVMDTPTGNQLPGECALTISHKIVTVMRITKQFRRGTFEFLKEKDECFSQKEFCIVPNAVPDVTGTGYDIDKIIGEIRMNVQSVISSNNKVDMSFIGEGCRGINEVSLFKFTEENLRRLSDIRELRQDELAAFNMYRLLAKVLAR